ncbi:MAG: hypothetical protein Q9222_005234 [Ikaeria aurantiellina]
MVRVPIQPQQSLPYPVTPTSPITNSRREQDSAQYQQASASSMSDAIGTMPLEPLDRHERDNMPAALRVGQASPKPQPDRITPSDLTPRSSSESQRYEAFVQPSNNPYHPANYTDTSETQSTKADNSTAVWANEPSRVAPGRPYLDKNQVQVPPMPATTMTSSEKTPFAEPWIDFRNPSEDPGLNTPGPSKASTNAWDEEQRKHDEKPNPTLPPRGKSYTNELQELEAQPFDEKPLPAFPSDKAIGNVEEQPPDLPPRDPVNDLNVTSSAQLPVVAHQKAEAKSQRNQTYEIRLINWYDASSPTNPRQSPIMVQNANGPCPLLALVNALILSTPAGLSTALIETVRVREQVTLGLLLDAVIDELMSGRRGDAAHNLPDVSELYAFLINLHTGMNVNPQFIDPSSSTTHILDEPITDPSHRSSEPRRPGGFEETPAMRLYSQFAVPLIHGWLPRRNHPVCSALDRSAKTYEDAQSLLFAEEELETKLQTQGLTNEEQRLLEDIGSVKYFLTSSPTQLTDYGLDTITESLRPGTIAILFRNDHFSTLYKEPRSRRIFTLVTDLGYSGHDEVVWESLVDIGGEGSEFFSGDFRPVGNNVASPRRQSTGTTAVADGAGWTTVRRSGGNNRLRSSLPSSTAGPSANQISVTTGFSQLSLNESQNSAMSPKLEQEDHDLALAMQLQEEEDEDRERQELAVRQRREDELSQAYFESQKSNPRPPHIPPRGGTSGGARRAPPRKQAAQADLDDAPPPTYEQAAKRPAYNPPVNNVNLGPVGSATSRPNANMGGGRPMRQTSAYSQTNSAFSDAGRPAPAARRQQPYSEREKECIVM